MTTTHKLWGNEEEGDPPTSHNSYTYNSNQEQEYSVLQRFSVVKILSKEADHEKKATLGGTFDFQIIFQGKDKMVGG